MTSNNKDKKNHYLPHIDGLRAIAIVFVVIYHFFKNTFVGGFIGVDIFFVISGYLISTILIKELQENKFSIVNFYKRRIIRIFPAMLLMAISILVMGYFCLFQNEYHALMRGLFRGLLFYINIWNGTVSTFNGLGLKVENNYFSPSTDLDLTNHLWSLAIEEQFYLIWPWLLFAIFKFIKNKKIQLASIAISLLASFLINIYLAKDYPAGTFFMPFTRFWELIFGGILAHIQLSFASKYQIVSGDKLIQNIASFVAIFIFIYCGIYFNENVIVFPGYLAFLPCLGAFLIIASKDSIINRKILSNKFLVAIGLISYPLYLWHWVFWSFGRILQGELDLKQKLILLILSIAFSVITYFFVEKPIRFGFKNLKNKIAPILLIFFFLTSVFTYKSFDVLQIKAFLSKKYHKELAKIEPRRDDYSFWLDDGFHEVNFNDTELNKKKPFGQKIMLIGDSFMIHYYPRIKHYYETHKDKKDKLYFGYKTFCSIGINKSYENDASVKKTRRKCIKTMKDAIEFALSHKEIEKIIISNNWANYFNKNKLEPLSLHKDESGLLFELERIFKLLKNSNKKVYLILSPNGKLDGMQDFKRSPSLKKIVNIDFNAMPLEKSKIDLTFADKITKIATGNVYKIYDPMDIVCDGDNLCHKMYKGRLIFTDTQLHFEQEFIKEKALFIDEILS